MICNPSELYEILATVLLGLRIDTLVTIAYGAAFLRIMVLAMLIVAVWYSMTMQ